MYRRNFVLISTAILLAVCVCGSVFPQEKEKQQDEEIEKLREKIAELEKTVAGLKDQQEGEAGGLEQELAQELGATQTQNSAKTQSQLGVSQATLSARRNLFQNMNPNISVIGTVLGTAHNLKNVERNVDLAFAEGEFSFQAAVDPYAKADFFITFVREESSPVRPGGEEEEAEEGGLRPEMEEAYITLLNLPFSIQLKAGRFRSKFGKINETHPHAYNFIGVPQIYQNFFGGEGMADEGIGVSWLVPQSVFFQELTVQVTRGPSENASFTRADNNKLLYLAHLKNFFDLNDDTTLELGVTGLTGPNNPLGDLTHMLGADLTVKWRPLQQNRSKSFEFMSEFLMSKRTGVGADVTSLGFYSHLRYQLAKRWFIGGLFDYSEFPQFSEFSHRSYSGILQFLVTEFQKFEMHYKYNEGNFFDSFSEFKARAVFAIGAHGAHQY